MKTTIIQTRVDEQLKTNAEQVFASIGIDMASAIRLFLTQVVNTHGIPFTLKAKSEECSFIAAEPAVAYGRPSPVVKKGKIGKIKVSSDGSWADFAGIVSLDGIDIKNDERLVYLLEK